MNAGIFGTNRPFAILAPMAGVTDWAYRSVCAENGTPVTVTEMVSAKALCYQDRKSVTLLRKTSVGLCGAQIFGSEPEIMAAGAKLALAHSDCDFLDINMGCPVAKVAGNGEGSALMKDPILAAEIVSAVAEAVPVPVTVKCRKGWDKGSVNVVPFAQAMEKAGASAITVHGRTKSMLYSGSADWDTIREVVQAVSVPVIANGDIMDVESALRCKARTGAAGYMIGRGAFGDPFLVGRIAAALRGEELPPQPTLQEKVEAALRQFELAREDKGEHIACLEARKHFAWYLRGVSHSGYYKEKITKISVMEDIYSIAKGILNDLV